MKSAAAALACSLLVACAPTTPPDAGPSGDDDAGGLIDGGFVIPPVGDGCPEAGPFVAHEESDGGVTRTVVTACSDERWVGLDLESGAELIVDESTAAEAWDIALQRYHVKSNGGVSGSGGVRVAPLAGASFDDVTAAPSDGFLEDQPDSDVDGHADYVISGMDLAWWRYNIDTHVIEMTGVVWVVESVEGNFFKLEFVDYYAVVDGSAASGYPTFRWAPLEGPPGAEDGGTGDAG